MKQLLQSVAKRVRHSALLSHTEGLWDAVRPVYLHVLAAGGRGAPVRIDGACLVRVPAEAVGGEWTHYEREAFQRFSEWLRAHPHAVVVDIGCANGLYSLVALFASSTVEVVAIDADAPSVAHTQWMTQHAPYPGRLHLVHALIGQTSTVTERGLAAAEARTGKTLERVDVGAATQYVCLHDDPDPTIPVLQLDALLGDLDGRSVIVKCDVEGAEMLVLRGADAFLRSCRPSLLLSVHHESMLAVYGTTRAEIADFLTELGYTWSVLSDDHEEHWWCEATA